MLKSVVLVIFLLCPFLASATDPSVLVIHEPLVAQKLNLWIVEFDSSAQKWKKIYSDSSFSPYSQISLAGTPHGSIIYGINSGTHDLYCLRNYRQYIPTPGVLAIATASEKEIYAVFKDNSVVAFDANANVRLIAPPSWFDPRFGKPTRIRRIDDQSFVVVTETGWIVRGQITGPNQVLVTDSYRHGGEIADIIVHQNHVWIYCKFAASGNMTENIIHFDSSRLRMTIPISPSGAPVQFLDVDPVSSSLIFRIGDDLFRTDLLAQTTLTKKNFASIAKLNALGMQLPPNASIAIDYPSVVTPWRLSPTQAGTAIAPSASAIGAGRTALASAAKEAKEAPKKLTPSHPLDPVTTEEFLKLIEIEIKSNGLKPLPPTVTVEMFASWIGLTTSLRFYFNDVDSDALKRFGLIKTGFSIAPLTKESEEQLLRVNDIVELLSKTMQAKTARACEAIL